MADRQTLAVYAARAADYAKRFGKEGGSQHLKAFLAGVVERLPGAPADGRAGLVLQGLLAPGAGLGRRGRRHGHEVLPRDETCPNDTVGYGSSQETSMV